MKSEYLCGLDLGRNHDYSALVIGERSVRTEEGKPLPATYALRYLRRWELRTPYPKIVEDVCAAMWAPPLDWPELLVDCTGVGLAVLDALKKARPRAKVSGVLITGGHATTREEGNWHVPKKELVGIVQMVLQQRRLKIAPIPERDTLLQELTTFKVKVSATTGHESFEAWRERDRDDCVLATALMLFAGERRRPRAGTR